MGLVSGKWMCYDIDDIFKQEGLTVELKVGMRNEAVDTVTESNTAIAYGSGSIAVYATPAMVGLMEKAALSGVDCLLPQGQATVGISLNAKHLAATPVGMDVRACAELTEVDGRRLVFKIEAFDSKEKIGECIHERFIISIDSFLQRTAKKQS